MASPFACVYLCNLGLDFPFFCFVFFLMFLVEFPCTRVTTVLNIFYKFDYSLGKQREEKKEQIYWSCKENRGV